MKLVVSLFILLSAGLSSAARADTSDRFAMGGWIEKFQPAIDQANASGELFRIRGHCQSNCTLFLGVRNVCVERGATLLFHAGHGRGANRNVINEGSTQRMLNAYNGKLRGYVTAKGYLAKLEFSSISGARMIDEFGYKECPRGG
jgi:hypothetical protein